ncbi:uncharacterized protein P174DRAFT_376226 [Aspergillus novofumigatus IBT 16806]|uniref:Uncharacterized protein n=1 Tax=Aspergillus novofumigatus (strain IBT 16806) TaxID=1392255 RepID=A0A2I1BZD9_ASPN1|nr:uncharacterized protein P174DRAFT_376226 [Aspergillus novofumigatus IBT 16806]PKX90721.1 hypothetical protein P174DRAFT_376226 [Aspergillus novofumigatus IBT 16806]
MTTPIRLSPQVQRIQSCSPYTDIFTNAPVASFRSRENTQHRGLTLSHAHPDLNRWQNSGSWGARHINDTAPFTLWDAENRKFRTPDRNEMQWIHKKFGDGNLGQSGWFMWIETANPPQPIPLTLACMPVIFVGIGACPTEAIPETPYPNPRIQDPCPTLIWPKMAFPTKQQNITLLRALEPFVCYGDGRTYEPRSLPGIVAGRTTLYHHADEPFYPKMRNQTRARFIDPAQHMNSSESLPQDDSNYLRRLCLTPGCRVESGMGSPGSGYGSVNSATTLGVKLRNVRGEEVVTVAHHGFLLSNEVYHPRVGGDMIGTVSDTRPELDIAFVKLTPAASASFTNECNFQAEPPRSLMPGDMIEAGSWSEVDGMSSGLVNLMAYGKYFMAPIRPIGHPAIPFERWKAITVNAVFGAINSTISEGICGAPIVGCESGGVTGFFHLSDGTNCLSVHLDDLIAEGWQVV